MVNSQVGQLLMIWGKLPWYYAAKLTKVLPFFVSRVSQNELILDCRILEYRVIK